MDFGALKPLRRHASRSFHCGCSWWLLSLVHRLSWPVGFFVILLLAANVAVALRSSLAFLQQISWLLSLSAVTLFAFLVAVALGRLSAVMQRLLRFLNLSANILLAALVAFGLADPSAFMQWISRLFSLLADMLSQLDVFSRRVHRYLRQRVQFRRRSIAFSIFYLLCAPCLAYPHSIRSLAALKSSILT